MLFDFRYYKTPEMYETRINQNLDLSAVDDEFQEIHMEIMERFYTLFNSVYQYYEDYAQYLKELSTGFFISHTVNSVLLDTDGRQLMCEALYLWGTMLLLLDELIPGPARERLIVAYFRCVCRWSPAHTPSSGAHRMPHALSRYHVQVQGRGRDSER